MSKRNLEKYRGTLNAEQVATGINAALANARRLAQDAESLLSRGSYPSAASLAALSIEESGKISILRELPLATDPNEVVQIWKRYRTHTQKNLAWILPQLVAKGARRLEDFRPLFDPASDHPCLLDSLKQLGFYTDCLGHAHWSVPQEVVSKELAEQLVQAAALLCRSRDVTVREIELWIEHIKPVWRGPMDWMKTALAKWFAAMNKEGLISDTPEVMEGFLYDDPSSDEAPRPGV